MNNKKYICQNCWYGQLLQEKIVVYHFQPSIKQNLSLDVRQELDLSIESH